MPEMARNGPVFNPRWNRCVSRTGSHAGTRYSGRSGWNGTESTTLGDIPWNKLWEHRCPDRSINSNKISIYFWIRNKYILKKLAKECDPHIQGLNPLKKLSSSIQLVSLTRTTSSQTRFSHTLQSFQHSSPTKYTTSTNWGTDFHLKTPSLSWLPTKLIISTPFFFIGNNKILLKNSYKLCIKYAQQSF